MWSIQRIYRWLNVTGWCYWWRIIPVPHAIHVHVVHTVESILINLSVRIALVVSRERRIDQDAIHLNLFVEISYPDQAAIVNNM